MSELLPSFPSIPSFGSIHFICKSVTGPSGDDDLLLLPLNGLHLRLDVAGGRPCDPKWKWVGLQIPPIARSQRSPRQRHHYRRFCLHIGSLQNTTVTTKYLVFGNFSLVKIWMLTSWLLHKCSLFLIMMTRYHACQVCTDCPLT